MDELAAIYQKALASIEEMKQRKEQKLLELRAILGGAETVQVEPSVNGNTSADSSLATPAKKRTKRLSALDEDEAENSTKGSLARKSARTRTSATLAEATSTSSAGADKVSESKSAIELMPPPPPAVPVHTAASDQSFARPQRAAKLHCEKNLKEPALNRKIRRPTNDEVQIKLEREQRASQMHETQTEVNKKPKNTTKPNLSIASTSSQNSVIVMPSKAPSIVTIDQSDQSAVGEELEKSQSKENAVTTVNVTRQLSVRIKREKLSEINGALNETNLLQKTQKQTTTLVESSVLSTTATVTAANTTNDTTQTKKAQRRKKPVPKPIKVERLSDVPAKDDNSEPKPDSAQQIEEVAPPAVEPANKMNTPKVNETIIIMQQKSASSAAPTDATMILGAAPNDATFCTAAAETFVVDTQKPGAAVAAAAAINDCTFDVASLSKDGTESQRSSDQSMATARDTLQPRAESLITEDESEQETTPAVKPAPALQKFNTLPLSGLKQTKFPTKNFKKPVHEIFNPLVQSPVKKKVEAFESVAAASKNTRNARSKLAKENSTAKHSLATTPQPPSRYLTTSQSSNVITPNLMAQTKKLPASASKAIGLTKSNSASNLRTIASAKAPTRGNSAEDVRRGAQLLAEERKKQRDQRQIQAAQLREAKERERAERLAKAAKERDEKRLKKQQQMEQKQRELLEIQRKLKQQEEAAIAAAAAEVAAQKDKLMKINQLSSAKARMPPPALNNQYTFEMLHEDDSTDDEGKVTYKRPPVPNWSLTHVRGPAILAQQHMPTEPIDFFFSVQPRTLDLKEIFPAIDPRHLKRNSSAIWQTPPRYSELPKY